MQPQTSDKNERHAQQTGIIEFKVIAFDLRLSEFLRGSNRKDCLCSLNSKKLQNNLFNLNSWQPEEIESYVSYFKVSKL